MTCYAEAMGIPWDYTKATAIAAWNRRTDLTPPAADYVAGLIKSGNVMANALRGDYIVPGAAAAWQTALAARPASPDTRVVPLDRLQAWIGMMAWTLRAAGNEKAGIHANEIRAIIEGGQDRG